MNIDTSTLARLLLDTYTDAKIAEASTTRSTRDAREFGNAQGMYDGVRLIAARTCRAHGRRIDQVVRAAHLGRENYTHAIPDLADQWGTEAVQKLTGRLDDLATRDHCDDVVLWRDEDIAQARKDLAPYRCLRLPGHDGLCAMHPRVASLLDQHLTPLPEDYTAPVNV